jgi:hypothetical protein
MRTQEGAGPIRTLNSLPSTGRIEGDKITYTSEGYGTGQKMKMREEMGKTGPKAGYHKMEMDMGKGFVPFAEDNCKK